jgi:hypothetical protein
MVLETNCCQFVEASLRPAAGYGPARGLHAVGKIPISAMLKSHVF